MNDTSHPLISIITIVFNGVKTIEQTINSVINQTYKNIEYIIIDGASTDGTVDIIRKYEDRIANWTSQPDKGIYDAMNKGVGKAKGKWIGIINSDDWYDPNSVENLIEQAREHPEVQIFHGLQRYIKSNGEVLCVTGSNNMPNSMFEHSTCFVLKEIYEKLELFNSEYVICGDYDLMLRAYNNSVKFHLIEKVQSNMRLTGRSESVKYFIKRRVENEMIKYRNGHKTKLELLISFIFLPFKFLKYLITK